MLKFSSLFVFIKGIFSNDVTKYKELYFPNMRSNENLKDNSLYLQSAVEQVNHLSDYCALNKDSRILDFGCGQGRLVNGIFSLKKSFHSYIGIDTNIKSINWCNRWLSRYSDKFRFIFLPAFNARYNQKADGLKSLPFSEDNFDIIFLNSVFSHMLSSDITFYLNEFNRILSENGRIYLTAFIEENVPPEIENPENYIDESSGRLHRVRYEQKFFFELVSQSGFKVETFLHQEISRTKQSVVILQKN